MFKLDAYIHDYLMKRKYGATSKTFQAEAEVSTDLNVVDAPAGFLYEWWSVFWDIFIARYMVQVPGAVVSCKEAVGAIDNGINQYDVDLPPRYVNNTSLSSRVGRLNLDWVDPDQSPESENEAFQRVMMLAGGEFMESIHFHAKTWLPARSIFMECLAARKDIDSTGEIMLLTRTCPWKLRIFEIEKEMKIDPCIKYVIYQDDRSNNWQVQAVAISPDKFQSREPLYEWLYRWKPVL